MLGLVAEPGPEHLETFVRALAIGGVAHRGVPDCRALLEFRTVAGPVQGPAGVGERVKPFAVPEDTEVVVAQYSR